MNKKLVPVIIILFFIFVWVLINLDDVNKMNEVHKITQQKEQGLFSLNNEQQEKLDNYIKEIAEIEVRECSFGAKIIFIKCGFTDNVARYALGDKIYQNIIDKIAQDRLYRINNMFAD